MPCPLPPHLEVLIWPFRAGLKTLWESAPSGRSPMVGGRAVESAGDPKGPYCCHMLRGTWCLVAPPLPRWAKCSPSKGMLMPLRGIIHGYQLIQEHVAKLPLMAQQLSKLYYGTICLIQTVWLSGPPAAVLLQPTSMAGPACPFAPSFPHIGPAAAHS